MASVVGGMDPHRGDLRGMRTITVILCAAMAMGTAGCAFAAEAFSQADEKILAGYRLGEPREAHARIEANVRQSGPDDRGAVERGLIDLVEAADATPEGRESACRLLAIVGSNASLPALERQSGDARLGEAARMAIEAIGTPESAETCRRRLDGTTGAARIGWINTLGNLRDRKAVAQLARLVETDHRETADAALAALGRIGTAEAMDAICAARVPAAFEGARDHAGLACAGRLAAEGHPDVAEATYARCAESERDAAVRVAGVIGGSRIEGAAAVPGVLALFRDGSPMALRAAAACVAEWPRDESITTSLGAILPELRPPARIVLMTALAERGDRAALKDVVAMAKTGTDEVRDTAFNVLSSMGDASIADAVLPTAIAGVAAAEQCLARIPDPGVDAWLIATIGKLNDPASLPVLMRVMAARGSRGGVPVLLGHLNHRDQSVRDASLAALGDVARAEDLERLVSTIGLLSEPRERDAMERSVIAAAFRTDSGERLTGMIRARMKTADEPVAMALIRIAGGVGGPAALTFVRESLKDPRAAVMDVAIRALAAWPDSSAAATVLELASSSPETVHHVLCLRGYVRLAELVGKQNKAEAAAMCEAALSVARRDEERELLKAARKRISASKK